MDDLHRRSERGNLFFYIFIAVALFGALSFAISQGNRGSVQSLERDRDKLAATEIIEYGEAVARAAAQIRLRGATPSQVSFAHADLSGTYGVPGGSDSEYEIFNSAGGGVVLKMPDSGFGGSNLDMIFSGANEVRQSGTTAGDSTSSDLIMVVRDVRQNICLWINVVLTVQAVADPIPEESEIDLTLFDGNFTYAQTLSDDDTGTPVSVPKDRLLNKSAGCVRDATKNEYMFYRVLLAR